VLFCSIASIMFHRWHNWFGVMFSVIVGGLNAFSFLLYVGEAIMLHRKGRK
jgi:hypothetical protein